SFAATMLAGFAAATLGFQGPFGEPAISSSIMILGLFVALAGKAPGWLGGVIAGLFAFFHGPAHASAAAARRGLPYASGVAPAPAGLHAAGIALGLFAKGSIGKVALRAMGGLAALGGLAVMAG